MRCLMSYHKNTKNNMVEWSLSIRIVLTLLIRYVLLLCAACQGWRSHLIDIFNH